MTIQICFLIALMLIMLIYIRGNIFVGLMAIMLSQIAIYVACIKLSILTGKSDMAILGILILFMLFLYMSLGYYVVLRIKETNSKNEINSSDVLIDNYD